MVEPIFFDIGTLVTSILVFIITGVLGWMVHQLTQLKQSIQERNKAEQERRRQHDKAVDEGLQAVLRSSITDAYERFVQNGEPLSVERKRVIELEHEAYANLGGNDVGDHMYFEIMKVPTTIIGSND